MQVHTSMLFAVASIGCLLSALVGLAGLLLNGTIAVLGGVSLLLCYTLLWASRRSNPKTVEFNDLRTFRDLARVLTEAKNAAT